MATSLMRRVVRSPLLHFAVIGGALFALAPRREDPRQVELSSSALAAYKEAQAARDRVPVLPASRAAEVEARAIEDEVLYREALRLGLEKDDPIIRQRLIQKLLLLVEDMGGASQPPTDAELRAFFEKDPSRYALPTRVTLAHVFASRPSALPAAEQLEPGVPAAAGEPFPWPRQLTASRDELTQKFGDGFARAVFALQPGAWSEPLQSSFGWHRVWVSRREAPRLPAFEEVRGSLALDYALDRRTQVVGEYLRRTVRDYRINVDGQAREDFSPTQRIAVRTAPSAED